MDLVAQVLVQLASVVAAVWGATEAMGAVAVRRNLTWFSKPIFAFILGPLSAIAAFKFGFLTTLPIQEGWAGIGGAAFAGFIAVGASNVLADVIKKGKEAFTKKGA